MSAIKHIANLFKKMFFLTFSIICFTFSIILESVQHSSSGQANSLLCRHEYANNAGLACPSSVGKPSTLMAKHTKLER